MNKIFVALILGGWSVHAHASTKLVCADRSRDTYSVDVTGVQRLAPGASMNTQLQYKPFRSGAYAITDLNCRRPIGNNLTAEVPPVLLCKTGEFEVTIQAEDGGPNLFADFYKNANLTQASVPCLLTESP